MPSIEYKVAADQIIITTYKKLESDIFEGQVKIRDFDLVTGRETILVTNTVSNLVRIVALKQLDF
jgi:hypothetical protein